MHSAKHRADSNPGGLCATQNNVFGVRATWGVVDGVLKMRFMKLRRESDRLNREPPSYIKDQQPVSTGGKNGK